LAITVRHEPRKEVIIHEISIYETPEQLVHSIAIGAPPTAVIVFKWVNGVLFNFSAFPLGGDSTISKEIVEGRLHWDHVSFASMPEFQEEPHFDNINARVFVVDVSTNETFQAIGEFLRNRLENPPN